ncbi:putative SERF-like protein [Onthophagus taurus]|uniref:putative SERF-like protein n=1 Tax=Onthophagus taurus TaxID=166361 RepID=UPI0039BE0E46
MTRGNQRELARAKNQRKQLESSKKKPSGGDGLTLEQRKFRDAEMMREKQRKKEDAVPSQNKK